MDGEETLRRQLPGKQSLEEGRDQQDHGEPDGQERAREGSYRLSSRTKSAGTGIGTPGQVQDSSQAGILVDEDCCQQPQHSLSRHMVTKIK